MVQWLGFCTSTEGDVGLLLGQVTKILHAAQKSKKKKKDVLCHMNKKLGEMGRLDE